MKKQELAKMRSLMATKKMMKMAADDSPQRQKDHYCNGYWERVIYKHGLYMRYHIQNDILKVAFFLAEHMRAGGRNPIYELFVSHESGQFITFDRLHDKWLTSKLDMLPWPNYVRASERKWINQAGYDAIKKYLGGQHGGYEGLLQYQLHIRAEELKRRYKRETDKWDIDLAQIPVLPKDWECWVGKVGILENYIFYQYSRKGTDTGYCTYCERDVPIKQPHHNKQGYCSRCRHKITFKSVGKAGTVLTERNSMYLIQRCNDGFVIRQFYGYRKYPKGEYTKFECVNWEIRRAIFNENGNALRTYYWGDYKRHELRWIPTDLCSPNWLGKEEGKVYGKTLPHLAQEELSRTGLIEMLNSNVIIDPEKYLAVLKVVPQLEKLAKAKLPALVNECMSSYYNFRENVLNIKANSLTKILGLNTQELKRLRQNNGGFQFLNWLKFEKATGKMIQDNVIAWFCTERIKTNDIQFIQNRMSVVQIYNYIRRQMSVYKCSSKDVLTKWADYLSMAKRLKMDTYDEIIFRVNKLFQRHDELVKRCHEKELAIQAGEILERYPHVHEIYGAIKEKYEYADKDYTIIVPTCIEEILLEGRNLSHCIANSDRYWERIERRETYVLFLRRTSDVDKSYYTLEIEPNGTIRQKRTMFDRQEPDIEDAKKFLSKWQNIISKRLTKEDRELAEESRTLRLHSYKQLRNDGVIIRTGELKGKLLIDVLLEDLMENVA